MHPFVVVCDASMTMVDKGNSVAGIGTNMSSSLCDERCWKYQMEDAQRGLGFSSQIAFAHWFTNLSRTVACTVQDSGTGTEMA